MSDVYDIDCLEGLRDRLKQFVQARWDELTWQEVELFEDIDVWLLSGIEGEP